MFRIVVCIFYAMAARALAETILLEEFDELNRDIWAVADFVPGVAPWGPGIIKADPGTNIGHLGHGYRHFQSICQFCCRQVWKVRNLTNASQMDSLR